MKQLINRQTLLCTSAICLAATLTVAAIAQDRTKDGVAPPTGTGQPAGRPAQPAGKPTGQDGAPQMDEATAKRVGAMLTAGAPGLEHQKLVARSGEWDLVVKFWMAPGAPEETSTAKATIEPILGGRFLRETVTGEMMGGPFQGEGILGYDNAAKQYVSTWIDSWSTSIMESRGTSSDGGKTIEMTTTHTDPVSGKPERSRMVNSMPDGRTMKLESFNQAADGKEYKAMEIAYTRRGSVGAPAAATPGAGSRTPGAPAAPARPAAPAAPARPAPPAPPAAPTR